jgi:hypothetical protein
MSGSTTCTVTTSSPVDHGLIAGQQVTLTIITGTAVGTYTTNIVSVPTTSSFTVVIGTTSLNTTGTASVYPQSMAVLAFSDSGGRIAAQLSYTVRGF